ncbi:MAG: glycosyltransferase, partial [Bacteroidota bacterium]
MLSILIPVYCYDVRPLVYELSRQLITVGIDGEIRVYDDASPIVWQEKNQELAEIGVLVTYQEMAKNLGRAEIRNILARDARFSTLLFLDADSGINGNFLENYLPFLSTTSVVVGGRIYGDTAIAPEYLLHHFYGSARESKTAKIRSKRPYQGFQTNNFLAPKSLLLRHPFDEKSRAYGHEDTLWGWQLQALQIDILHINNPVE